MADLLTRRPAATARWLRCDRCSELVYRRHWIRDLSICPHCGWHGRLDVRDRLNQLLDPGSAVPLGPVETVADPLTFVDSRPYVERLQEARDRTGLREAVLCVQGRVDGRPVVSAAMEFRFLGGSLGTAEGEQITKAAETALRTRQPLLIVAASGGARMQEGALSLMQMAKTSQALGALDDAGVLVVCLVTDPTYGGVAASFASLADVIIAEPGARLGFAGPRVIERTLNQTLPDGFQTGEFLVEHGLIDAVAPRGALRSVISRLLAVGRSGVSPASGDHDPAAVDDPVIRNPGRLPRRNGYELVHLARDAGRPTTLDYIAHLFDGFFELHGDRMSGDCPAIVGGPACFDGLPVMVVGHQKGHTTQELVAREFGMATPDGYRKAARLMRLAAKLGLPLITFIDTPGAYPGVEAERHGQAIAIAENLRLMARLPVPIVAVVLGEGGSGGALALGVADKVLMCENSIYSVISPEGCAAILWRTPQAAPQAAAALRLGARDLLELGLIDGVIPEPEGGAQADHTGAADLLRRALQATLRELPTRDTAHLLRERHHRFRRFGRSAPTAGEASGV